MLTYNYFLYLPRKYEASACTNQAYSSLSRQYLTNQPENPRIVRNRLILAPNGTIDFISRRNEAQFYVLPSS